MSLSNEINSSKLGVDNQSTIPISVIGPTSTYASLANVSYELGRYGQTDAAIISATRFVGSIDLGGPEYGFVYVDPSGAAKVSTNVYSKYGGLYVTGNLSVLGDFNVVGSNNVIITDPIFEIANGVADGDDRGFIMQRPSGNVLIGHIGSSDELVLSYTDSSAEGTTLTPDLTKQLNVSILGNLFVSNVISGDGSNISNTNDVYSGTFGSGAFIPQITFTDGRISGVTNVPVSGSIGAQTLEEVVDLGNTTSNVVLFENATTAFVTTGNVLIGTDLILANTEANTIVATNNVSAGYYHGNAHHLVSTTNVADGVYGSTSSIPQITIRDGRVDIIEGQSITLDKSFGEVSNIGNATTNVIQFNNATTAFTTIANVTVGGNLDVSGLISGDGGSLSNMVDVSDGVYGGELGNIAKITVTSGRITSISNVSVELDKSLQDVTDYGNTTTQITSFTNQNISLTTVGNVLIGSDLFLNNNFANTIVATNNVSAGYYHGNAHHLVSTTNVADGVYGSTSSIPQITIRDGRVDIIEGQSITLDKSFGEVSNIGNATTNVIQFNNATTAFTTIANVTIGGNLDVSGLMTGDGGGFSNMVDVSDGTYGGELGNIAKFEIVNGRITNVSNVSVEIDKTFQEVTDYGNTTTNVVQFNNATTAFTTAANVIVGGNLDVSGLMTGDGGGFSNMVDVSDGTYGGELGNIAKFEIVNGRITNVSNVSIEVDKSLQDVTDYGNTTTQITSFTNSDVSVTTSGNVLIGGVVHFTTDDIKLFGVNSNLFVGNSISIGNLSGHTGQSGNAVAIGNLSGKSNQSDAAIAVGLESGFTGQGSKAIALGYQAGNDTQGSSAISIGEEAGLTSQKVKGVAIGYKSGYINQGSHSIAIGSEAGLTNQDDNTIIINATGSSLDSVSTDGLYVAPIRQTFTQFANVMASNATSKEVVTSIIAIENSNVGIANSSPGHTLAVGSNVFIQDDGSNIIVVSGNISCGTLHGNVTVTELTFGAGAGPSVQSITLQDICEVGNTYDATIFPESVNVSGYYYGNAWNMLSTTNVAAGTYGSSTEIPVIVVDSNARVDYISTQTITADISGTGTSGEVALFNGTKTITSDANLTFADGTVTSLNVEATNKFIGDGSELTGIDLDRVTTLGNVAETTVLFQTATNSIVTEGRVGVANTNPLHEFVVGDKLIVSNTEANTIVATNNIAANYFIGDGSLLENLPGAGSDTLEQVVNRGNTTSNVVLFENATTGFVTTGNVLVGDKLTLSNTEANTIVATNNVSAGYYHGNAKHLTNTTDVEVDQSYGSSTQVPVITTNDGRIQSITSTSISFPDETDTLSDVVDRGNTTSNVILFENAATAFVTTGNVLVGDKLTLSNTEANTIVSTNNVSAPYYHGNASELVSTTDATPGTYGDGANVAVVVIDSDGRIQSISNVAMSANLEYIVTNGNSTSNTILFENATTGFVTTGNVLVGDKLTLSNTEANTIVATNNIAANYFIGDGSLLDNLPSDTLSNVVDRGNTTSNTMIFETSTVSLVTDGRIGVANTNPLHEIAVGTDGAIFMNGNVNILTDGTTICVGSDKVFRNNYSIAMGTFAGLTAQYEQSISIGREAGNSVQGSSGVAIGAFAGNSNQGSEGIAIGVNAAPSNQGVQGIAIGSGAGLSGQKLSGVAIGAFAAQTDQGSGGIAIGRSTGLTSQGDFAVAIGVFNASSNQQTGAVSIGYSAGVSNQNTYAVAIGYESAVTSQASYAVAMGYQTHYAGSNVYSIGIGALAGRSAQYEGAVAMGRSAGTQTQGSYGVAVGYNAGYDTQGDNSIAVGHDAGITSQSSNAISIGTLAGNSVQGSQSIAIGQNAGYLTQGSQSVTIGAIAGQSSQGERTVAVGYATGESNQGSGSVAIGFLSGRSTQGVTSVAIGRNAGNSVQGSQSIAIGLNAGQNNQGTNCIAIGPRAGQANQHNNTIVLDANNGALNTNGTDRAFIRPIRSTTAARTVYWNPTTYELVASTTKSFMMDHPTDSDRYLVHACLEGPEEGIYYRGRASIVNTSVEVTLPSYVPDILVGTETIQVTPHHTGTDRNVTVSAYNSSTNSFTIYGSPGTVDWVFYGARNGTLDAQPLKNNFS